MNTKEENVSAFAFYSGINGNLTRRQKRRKNQNIRKQNAKSQVSSEPSDSVKNVTKKKRKNIEDNDDIRLEKKRKSSSDESKVKKPVKTLKNKTPSENIKKKSFDSKNLNNSIPERSVKTKEVKRTTHSNGKASTVVGDKTKEKIKLHKLKKINLKKLTFNRKSKSNFTITTSTISTSNSKPSKNIVKESLEKIDSQTSTSKLKNDKQLIEPNNHLIQYKLDEKLHVNEKFDPLSTLISKIDTFKKNITNPNNNSNQVPNDELRNFQKKIAIQKCSTELGNELFQDLIAPFSSTEFFKDHWEKAPLYVPGSSPTKFSKLLSTPMIDDFLRNQVVMFGKHIDITSYKNGKRETHNLEGRALPHVVWDLYNHKCSVRLLCPQAAFNNIFAMNTKLQDYFGCFVGANVYLTPPNSQGFAPHYDDIEAFVLQVEGKKRWKIYSPRNKYETLPRYSSKNFNESDVGSPLMEVTLNPGDFLYFPRGFIHQADTCGNVHSLHITVSVYQKNSWVDLLEKALPIALNKAAREDVDFRRGLPLNFLRHGGIAYHSVSMRKQLIKAVKDKMMKLIKYLDIDSAVDMMGMQYITDALPPLLSYEEASRSVFGNGLRMKYEGQVTGSVSFAGNTKVRFTKALCHRLVKEMVKSEDDTDCEVEEFRLYYSIDNSLEYHGEEPQFLVVPEEYVKAINVLSLNYPAFTRVDTLPLPSLSEQARLVGDLWDRGILMTEQPLQEEDVVIESDEEEITGNNEDGSLLQQPNSADISPLAKLKDAVNDVDDDEDEDEDDSDEELEVEDHEEEKEEEEQEEDDEEDDNSFGIYEKAIDENKQYIRDNELKDSDKDVDNDEINLDEINLDLISDEEHYYSDHFSSDNEIEDLVDPDRNIVDNLEEEEGEDELDIDSGDDEWWQDVESDSDYKI